MALIAVVYPNAACRNRGFVADSRLPGMLKCVRCSQVAFHRAGVDAVRSVTAMLDAALTAKPEQPACPRRRYRDIKRRRKKRTLRPGFKAPAVAEAGADSLEQRYAALDM